MFNIFEEVKDFVIDLKDEIDMSREEPKSLEEQYRIASAYDWRCVGLEEE